MSNTSEEEQQNRVGRLMVMSKDDSGIPIATKKRRNPPGNPDPDAEVVALSPRTLLATNRYICEVCHKGFQRDQNLQLHRRGHNLPWKLKQRTSSEVKKRVYVCPEATCAHHDPNRALGDLTGIKKHYSRKHGEKKWKCDKCSKRYAVKSDWKAHSKICGTKEYRCDCGTIFSRKDSFVTHRAFCDALTEENFRGNHGLATMVGNLHSQPQDILSHAMRSLNSSILDNTMYMSGSDPNTNKPLGSLSLNPLIQANSDILFNNSNSRTSGLHLSGNSSSISMSMGSSIMSATALLQKAAEMGVKASDESISPIRFRGFTGFPNTPKQAGSLPDTTNSYNNNYAQCLDTAEVSSEGGNTRFMHSSVGGSYVGVQNALEMSLKRTTDASGFRATNIVPFALGVESKIDSNRRRDNAGEDNANRSGRMTQDFLGLGGSGSMSVGSAGNPNFDEDEMYSYHQMSNGPTALGKHLWDY